MIRTLEFPSAESLVAALRADLLPPHEAARPVLWESDPPALRVAPRAPLPDEVRAALEAFGARDAPLNGDGTPAACWAEVLPTRRVPLPEHVDEVLFEMPATELLPLAGELVRLGCDRQRWCAGDRRALLLARDPPWYSVQRALDRIGSARAYARAAGDVWVELGFDHPLARRVRAGEGSWVLIPGDGRWSAVPNGAWRDLYDQLAVELPPAPVRHVTVDPPRLSVALRLVDRGPDTPPSLWVLREDGIRRMDALLATVPEEIVERLAFAAVAAEAPLIVLRARPSPRGPPALELGGEAYAPWMGLHHLYLPADASLEPPLRQDRLREVLAPDPSEVTWLRRAGPAFRVERLAESAFRPLSAWVDYVAERDAAFEEWIAAAHFEFDDWVDAGMEWGPPPDGDARPAPRSRRERPDTAGPAEDIPASPPTVARPARSAAPSASPLVVEAGDAEVSSRLAALERRFLDSDAPLDAPERVLAWTEMAAFLRRLGRHREATLAWVHAVWSAPGERQAGLRARWADDELAALGLPADAPSSELTHDTGLAAVAAGLAAGRWAGDSGLVAWLVRRESELDVRSAWLAREAAAGGDELNLARARDALLARIRGGLDLVRDTPVFLRQLDAEALRVLGAHLSAQRDHFRRTRRDRSIVEADPALTGAYVDLVFAWGFAALGDADRARELVDGTGPLDLDDPVHGALVAAYRARIDDALKGRPREAPLPPAVAVRLEQLTGINRFKADRLRVASGILEARDHVDPFVAFSLGRDPRGEEFSALRGLDDPDALRARLAELVPRASGADAGRIALGVVEFLPLLRAVDAIPLLDGLASGFPAIPTGDRVRVLEGALLAAGQFGKPDRVRDLASLLGRTLAELPADALAARSEAVVHGLRALRRVGLQATAGALLEEVLGRARGADPDALVTRIAVAGGLFALGRDREAVALVDEGLQALDADFKVVAQRLRLTRALGLTLASAPREVALDRLPRLSAHLAVVTDLLSTNSHFCLSVVSFAESVVLGYADAHHALSPLARRWMDDAEFLVRRRIHG